MWNYITKADKKIYSNGQRVDLRKFEQKNQHVGKIAEIVWKNIIEIIVYSHIQVKLCLSIEKPFILFKTIYQNSLRIDKLPVYCAL